MNSINRTRFAMRGVVLLIVTASLIGAGAAAFPEQHAGVRPSPATAVPLSESNVLEHRPEQIGFFYEMERGAR